MVVNHFKMRSNVNSYNLGGMGCSAGVIAIGLAKELLQVTLRQFPGPPLIPLFPPALRVLLHQLSLAGYAPGAHDEDLRNILPPSIPGPSALIPLSPSALRMLQHQLSLAGYTPGAHDEDLRYKHPPSIPRPSDDDPLSPAFRVLQHQLSLAGYTPGAHDQDQLQELHDNALPANVETTSRLACIHMDRNWRTEEQLALLLSFAGLTLPATSQEMGPDLGRHTMPG